MILSIGKLIVYFLIGTFFLQITIDHLSHLHLDDPDLMEYGSGLHPKQQKLPSRSSLLNEIRHNAKNNLSYDLLVIGMGSAGAGVALDATTRGLNVIGLDQDDFASGTSSRSTKLLHGGVRYLKKAMMNPRKSYSQWKLVREALRERWIMFQQNAHLTNSVRIVAPVYTWKELIFTYLQMKLYDWIAFPHIHSSYYMPRKELEELYPHLRYEDKVPQNDGSHDSSAPIGAVCYYDGQFDDARFNLAVVQTAIQKGAHILNYAKVVDIIHDEFGYAIGAVIEDKETGERINVRARQILNAAGAFSDEVRKMDSVEAKEMLTTACGAHIVLDRRYSGAKSDDGLLITKTKDRRVLFVLPWHGKTLVGTTDSKCGVTNNPRPSETEIEYLIEHINNYFSRDQQVSRKDVLSAWSGIRPLKKASDERETASISREHVIFTAKDTGIKSIIGGKWTTYRKMAEEVVDKLIADGNYTTSLTGQNVQPVQTAHLHLHGHHEYNPKYERTLSVEFHIPIDIAHHVNEAYGDQSYYVLQLAKETDTLRRLVKKGGKVKSVYPYLEAEVLYAIRYEYARHPVDFLERRIRLSMLDSKAAQVALPRVVELFAKELKWKEKRVKQETQRTKELLQISSEKVEKVEKRSGGEKVQGEQVTEEHS